MGSIRVFLVLTIFSLTLVLADGLPAGNFLSRQVKKQANVPCETVDKYTVDWFLRNELPDYTSPLQDNALFYTRGMSETAITHARKHKLTTIWDVWPCSLYIYHDVPDNKMRCIHSNPASRQQFYESMSQAFAVKARGSVKVMHSTSDYDSPPINGIWANIEFPTMKNQRVVNKITKIDEVESKSDVCWRRSSKVGLVPRSMTSLVETMRVIHYPSFSESCMAPWEYTYFNKIDW